MFEILLQVFRILQTNTAENVIKRRYKLSQNRYKVSLFLSSITPDTLQEFKCKTPPLGPIERFRPYSSPLITVPLVASCTHLNRISDSFNPVSFLSSTDTYFSGCVMAVAISIRLWTPPRDTASLTSFKFCRQNVKLVCHFEGDERDPRAWN